jgi:hypothetical protein
MNKYRRVFLILTALLSLGMTGCVTTALYEKIREDASYTEEVTSVMISEDGKKLVFIGYRYHYVFDVPVGLSLSLQSSFRKSLYTLFRDFKVDNNNHITGNIIFDGSASQEGKKEAIELGYNKRSSGTPALEISLQGKRYRSGDVATDRVEYKLNCHPYNVPVLEEGSFLEKTALTALTPITVLADGVIVIAGVTLILVTGILVNGGV